MLRSPLLPLPCHLVTFSPVLFEQIACDPQPGTFKNTTSNHPTRNFTPMALLWPRTTSTINATSAKMASTMPKVIGTSITLCIGHIAQAAPPVWRMDVSRGRAGEARRGNNCRHHEFHFGGWRNDSQWLQVNPTFALCLSKISFQATNDEPYMLRTVSQASDFSTSLTLRSGSINPPNNSHQPCCDISSPPVGALPTNIQSLAQKCGSTIQEWRSKTI